MIRYHKGSPTEYAIKYVGGAKVREGLGASFFYWPGRTTIVSVPAATTEADFILNEVTADFQTVVLQGQVTYRIAEPARTATLLNFEIDPAGGGYRSRDPGKVPARVANLVGEAARLEVQRLSLEEALRRGPELAGVLLERLRSSEDLQILGVAVLKVFVVSLRPTPEVSKALEADYRELLLKRADGAIYARRAAAVEQERKIRENELETDIALERERGTLVDLRAANLAKEAEAEAKALDAKLGPYRTTDAQVLVALALKALGDNAAKIGTLTITPDLISEMLRGARKAG